MSVEKKDNIENQEIDLGQLSNLISSFFEKMSTLIFECIQFFVNKRITISILFLIGFVLGSILDKTNKKHESQIIVSPNFDSTDYLYSKINLIQSKIDENDTVFLKKDVGIQKPNQILKIEIKPIIDVYKFIENKPENFELIKLIAEDGDIKSAVEANLTSKNYKNHKITFVTKTETTKEEILDPTMLFLNETDYYKKIQKEEINNIKIKIAQNETIISQINRILDGFSSGKNGAKKSDKLVYYNENTQLNEIIKTKENLVNEQGANRLNLIIMDKIVKENSSMLNIENNEIVYGKLNIIIPGALILLFLIVRIFINFYLKQSQKNIKTTNELRK